MASLPLAVSAETDYELGGFVKTRGSLQSFPEDSLLRELAGSNATDLSGEFRLLFEASRGAWDVKADGQLIALYGDTVEYTREIADLAPGFEALFGRLPNDDRRWFDLTSEIEDEDKRALIARLERASVGYTGANTVARFGRQAISWGNGLVYSPMDIVNPFDPTQVDTEYKAGDDMLYGQFLRGNGDDIQATAVVRRDPLTDDVETEQGTVAAKYHGLLGVSEYDLLAAWHYDEPLAAIGATHEIGGAVWRGDLVLSFTDDDGTVTQFVTNLSYSWEWWGKNISGTAEYFFNGFGRRDDCYTPDCLASDPALVERIARRQLYTLGRHYLAGGLMVEVTPLFTLTPNLFWNVGDGSALLQIVPQYSLGDNFVLLGAVGLPLGPSGTEYGGIDTGIPGRYFSTDFSAFLQLGWYF